MQLDLGPADAVVVLSHDPKFDDPAVLGALERGCRYVGVMGSRKTQAARRQRLLEQGASEADLARVHAPVGLDLGGRTPAETALAILAEIVAVRNGGSGESMIRRADRVLDQEGFAVARQQVRACGGVSGTAGHPARR